MRVYKDYKILNRMIGNMDNSSGLEITQENEPTENESNEPTENEPTENESTEPTENESTENEPNESIENESMEKEEKEENNSIQNAPTVNSFEYDPMLFIQLGDRVIIESDEKDSINYGKTIGTVYYRGLDRISIKPDGVSNELRNFELEQTDEKELYKESITAAYVIEKRTFESFVEQNDFRVNQIIDTFDNDGMLYNSYKIITVDVENDSIQIQPISNEIETKNEFISDDIDEIKFNFIGINSDERFKMISIRELVPEPLEPLKPLEQVEEKEEKEEKEEEEDDEIEIVGVIEITRPVVYEEVAFFEQQIPDTIQKIDALNDFISSIDSSIQNDPKSLRTIRILVEILFNLKQETIAYNNDGSVKGTKDISVTTLSELIKKVPVPLGRPVLNIKKKLYSQIDEDSNVIQTSDETDDVYFEDFKNEQEAFFENKSTLISSFMDGAPGNKIVREWNDQHTYLKKYLSPWSSSISDPLWKALSDTDFFRSTPPELSNINDTTIFLDTIQGYIPTYDKKKPLVFHRIPFGMERALATTFRKGLDKRKQVLLPEENATMDSYLLFPIKMSRYLGLTRSSSIAIDSGRSQMKKDTMKGILEKTGAPTDVGTSNNLVLLDTDGNTLSNIPLGDYIEGLSVPALGLGDTFETINHYGMNQLELTPSIIEILITKIEIYQSHLVNTLATLREIIDKVQEIQQNPFMETNIFEDIKNQPMLLDDIIDYEKANPSLIESDIGKVSHLLKKHPYYFQVVPGMNSRLIAKARDEANKQRYMEELYINNIIENNKANTGDKPKPNTCEHVKNLLTVRRIQDDTERFKHFIVFFKKYQGARDNNWLNCYKCKEHLICIHERLQLQAYLQPKEKDSIQKEIILKFSGGQFQGKYICRNCGQPIKDIDFDNNMEFDDNGKPKSGNAVLIDDDALFEEYLNDTTNVPIAPSPKMELQLNEEQIKCYDIIIEISARIGITLVSNGIQTIIDKTIYFLNKFPKREVYKVLQEKRAKEKRNIPDYDVAISRHIITAAATFLFLEIQTRIPSYNIRYVMNGCKSPGFGGYPLDTDITQTQGIKYMSCAVASIHRNDSPWNQTGFPADVEKRQNGIFSSIDNVLKQIIGDNIIQAELSEKRKYIAKKSEMYGSKDVIPATFLPEQIIITPEDAAKDVIIPEVGKENVKLWIRQAHVFAKKTASLVNGSPLIETSCCMSSIETPGSFWNHSELPYLDKRTLTPHQQGQFLVTEFISRPSGSDVVEPDTELYYRIFLKCCFEGPRIGYTHEPGLTNVCTWCGFQFPTIPSVMDTDTEGKTALASQNVKTTTEEFIKLLDTIHTVNKVDAIQRVELSTIVQIMEEFSVMNPPPIANWTKIILETTNEFLKLPPDADISDIAIAAGFISDATQYSDTIIHERIKIESHITIVEEIVKLSWVNFFQVIQTYFITPFQRMLTEFQITSLVVPCELKSDLSYIHVKEDIQPMLDNDTLLIKIKGNELKDSKLNIAKSKIKYFLKQMSAILVYKNKIRPSVIPGGKYTLEYIQRILLYGPLATLLNPSDIPDGVESKSPIKELGNTSQKYLRDVILYTLNKFNTEKLIFNDKQLKEKIAIRDEKERANIIAQYSKLTDEERAIELMNQRLGLGKYSVGGTKLIYAYDKDYYNLEREKRLAAGIIEFPGSGNGEMLPPEGHMIDENGFRLYTDNELEEGYEHNQYGDDE